MYETVIAVIDCVNHYAPALTFIATSLGVGAASFAAWRAKQLLEAGREADRNQNRAYLTVSKCEIALNGTTIEPLSDGSRRAYIFRLWVKNTGATPAEWFFVNSEACIRSHRDAGTADVTHRSADKTRKWRGMAAGEEISFFISGKDALELLAAATKIRDPDTHVILNCTLQFKTLLDDQPRIWQVGFSVPAIEVAEYGALKAHERQFQVEWDTPTPPIKMRFIPIEADD